MRRQDEVPLARTDLDEPFGPSPVEYLYRCPVCGTECLVNEAIIDAGFMPTVGCPGCDGDTMVYVETK